MTWLQEVAMTKLLYVEGSPRKHRSASIEVCWSFLDAYRETHPDDEIETLDIWASDLPAFDGAALEAKYAGLAGVPLSGAQQAAWDCIRKLAHPFLTSDKILLGVPLWNFGIPYRLKQLIDLISQKDVLFSFDGSAFAGLATARKAAIVYARGLDYQTAETVTPAEEFDFQRPYMRAWLRFIGVPDIVEVIVEKTLFSPDIDDQTRAVAKHEAATLAQIF
jgi:FMN-dependent NADH-azoreductase